MNDDPVRLIPELTVRDWRASLAFYSTVLGFNCHYMREEDGFAMLDRDGARIMIDQIGIGRDFDGGLDAVPHPWGRGVNLQIAVKDVLALWRRVTGAGARVVLPLEERWYRVNGGEAGNRQFVVADPDGYLLRFYEDMETRER